MLSYNFLNSSLCYHLIDQNPQLNAFQHILPPLDMQQLKMSRQQNNNQEILVKKSQQIKMLTQKNNQLINIINQKDLEKIKINKKYNQLIIMFQQNKNKFIDHKNKSIYDPTITQITQENYVLCQKIKKLEKQLMESEKQLNKKIKLYQDKNQDSRKLLEKLNQNTSKRQEKFKLELQQTQCQLKKRNQQYTRLQQQHRSLLHSHLDKQDQLTKLLQQSQRDKSAFSQNISSIQSKLQTQNNKLNEQVTFQYEIIEQLKKQYEDKLKNSNTLLLQQQHQNQQYRIDIQNIQENLEDAINKLNKEEIKCKEIQIKQKILQANNSELMKKNKIKVEELEKIKSLFEASQIQLFQLKRQHDILQQQHQLTLKQKQQYNIHLASTKHSLQQYEQLMKQKLNQIASYELSLQSTKKQLKQLTKFSQQQKKQNEQLKGNLKKSLKKIQNFQQLLHIYKTQKYKNRSQLEKQWNQMTKFYQIQIEKLNHKFIQWQSKNQNKFSINGNRCLDKQIDIQ